MTDYIASYCNRVDLYGPLVPIIADALQRSGETRIVDLCSGSSGPLLKLRERLSREHGLDPQVLLSDRYPDLSRLAAVKEASGGRIDFIPEPVDATTVPEKLRGFRTLFQGFHHFRPEQARAILQDAVQNRAPIGVFEMTERTFSGLLLNALTPVGCLTFTPFVKPRTAARYFLTFAVPLTSIVLTWDGLVSCLRSYTPGELQTMIEELKGPPFRWQHGRVRSGVHHLTWLIGMPA